MSVDIFQIPKRISNVRMIVLKVSHVLSMGLVRLVKEEGTYLDKQRSHRNMNRLNKMMVRSALMIYVNKLVKQDNRYGKRNHTKTSPSVQYMKKISTKLQRQIDKKICFLSIEENTETKPLPKRILTPEFSDVPCIKGLNCPYCFWESDLNELL